jgi:uncharacterized protein YdeI (YjbR/CyaY-like superfamily)
MSVKLRKGTMRTNPDVNTYLQQTRAWRDEQKRLREVLLDTPLSEELKWGKPCYTFDGHNIVIMQPFKHCLALMFFKGALLNDPNNVLVKFGEHTRSARRIEFTTVQEIVELEPVVKAYIDEAIDAEKAGLKVDSEQDGELPVPEEFQAKLDENPALRTAFEGLTPGRQREYLLHFSSAKQSQTRESRVEKSIPRILEGIGLREGDR